jgi:hypothetical protein
MKQNLVANNNNDANENLADSVGMDVAVAVNLLFTGLDGDNA